MDAQKGVRRAPNRTGAWDPDSTSHYALFERLCAHSLRSNKRRFRRHPARSDRTSGRILSVRLRLYCPSVPFFKNFSDSFDVLRPHLWVDFEPAVQGLLSFCTFSVKSFYLPSTRSGRAGPLLSAPAERRQRQAKEGCRPLWKPLLPSRWRSLRLQFARRKLGLDLHWLSPVCPDF